jgi:hypothetical protein
MVNHSSVKQILETDLRNNVSSTFDIDMSSTCSQLSDADQVMKNINVDGSKNVTFEQVNEAHNLCKLQSMAELDILTKLSSETKNALADTLSQTGGILPGLNNSERDQRIMTAIRNDITTDVMLDQSKECIQKLNQTQRMTEINVGDSMNVRFSQANKGFNECLADSNASIAAKVDAAMKAEAEAEGSTTQAGALANIGSLIGMGAAGGLSMLCSPILICCCVVIAIAMIMMGGGGDEASELANSEEGKELKKEGMKKLLSFAKKGGMSPLNGGGCQFGGVSEQIIDRTKGFFQGVIGWVQESPGSSLVIVILVIMIMMSAVKKMKKEKEAN